MEKIHISLASHSMKNILIPDFDLGGPDFELQIGINFLLAVLKWFLGIQCTWLSWIAGSLARLFIIFNRVKFLDDFERILSFRFILYIWKFKINR